MREGDVIAGRYEALRQLGAGATASTFLARDRQTGGSVAVKLLTFGKVTDWKTVELFEREAKVLGALSVPGVPAYIDFFTTEGEGGISFVLVRQYIPGQSLQEAVDRGWRGSEEEIRRIGARLLRIVHSIHALRPPIIHRDINPKNVIKSDDGEIFLVDFGGVQDAVRSSALAGATFVGTPGYTPLEQFVGRATVRSDLYAFAATLLFLLTHKSPADLPAREMKIDVPAVIELSSAALAGILDEYLDPDESKRILPEEQAIDLLEGKKPVGAPFAPPLRIADPPLGSRIRVKESPLRLELLVPERGRAGGLAALGGFSFFWLCGVGAWTAATISMGAPLFFPLFSIPFWGVGLFLVSRILSGVFGKVEISIDRQGFSFTRRLLFLKRRLAVPLSEVGECAVDETFARQGLEQQGARQRSLLIEAGTRSLRFGVYISERERQWLASALNGALARFGRPT